MGIEGVAIGTLIPMAVFSPIVTILVMRWLEVRAGAFVEQVVLPGVLAGVVFVTLAVLALRLPGQGQWSWFFVKTGGVTIVYGLFACGLLLCRARMRAGKGQHVSGTAQMAPSGLPRLGSFGSPQQVPDGIRQVASSGSRT